MTYKHHILLQKKFFFNIKGTLINIDRKKKKKNKDGKKVEDEEEEDLTKLIFKPSGPDGRFWGQFREFNEEEIERFLYKKEQEEQRVLEQEIQEKKKTHGEAKAKKVRK